MTARYPVAYREGSQKWTRPEAYLPPKPYTTPKSYVLPKRAFPGGPDTATRRAIRQAVKVYGKRVISAHPLMRGYRLLSTLHDVSRALQQRPGLNEGGIENVLPTGAGSPWRLHCSCAIGGGFPRFGTNAEFPPTENPPGDCNCYTHQSKIFTFSGNWTNNKHIEFYGLESNGNWIKKLRCYNRSTAGATHAAHSRPILLRWPAVKLDLDPFLAPIGQAVAQPKVSPMPKVSPALNPYRSPMEQTVRGEPRTRSGAAVITRVIAVTHPAAPPMTPPVVVGNTPVKPPHKEVKVRTPLARFILGVVNVLTESTDAVVAIWKAIPAQYRSDCRTLQCDLSDIYKHWDKINWAQAFANLLVNQIEDWAIGKFGSRARQASRDLDLHHGLPVGIQSGGFARQELFAGAGKQYANDTSGLGVVVVVDGKTVVDITL